MKSDYRKRIESGKLSPTEIKGSKEYFISKTWSSLKQRCVNSPLFSDTRRNSNYKKLGIRLEMTRNVFESWIDMMWPLIEDFYRKGQTPSLDRKDSYDNYCLSNIQIIDLKENMSKDRRKPVYRFDPNTGGTSYYESETNANIDSFCRQNISRAIKKGFRHKGYYWAFA